jgi:hypothetical protein
VGDAVWMDKAIKDGGLVKCCIAAAIVLKPVLFFVFLFAVLQQSILL